MYYLFIYFFDIEFGFVDILHMVINMRYLDYVNCILFILFGLVGPIAYWLFVWAYRIVFEILFPLTMCIINVSLLIVMNFGPTMWVNDLNI